MPDGPRESFRPVIRVNPLRTPQEGFTVANTFGLSDVELASLNTALRRLMAAGLDEHDAKRALDTAVREGMEPNEAADAELAWLISWH